MKLLLSSVFVLFFAARVSAFFRLNCGASITVQRLDPIVSPGVLSSHVHMVTGGSAFNATSDSAALRASKCSTCEVIEDRSAYWIPELYFQHTDGSFEQVDDDGEGGLLIYYQQKPAYTGEVIYGIPQGLRMVSGTPSLKTYDPNNPAQVAIQVSCIDYNYGHKSTQAMPQWNCPQGLRAEVTFPQCWDGINLDSVDHKSHMAFPDQVTEGKCPASHPKKIISIFYEKYYNTGRFASDWLDAAGRPTRVQPFYWSTGDNSGYSLHGDFLDGWNTSVIAEATQICNSGSGVIEECPVFHFETGRQQSACQPEYPPFSPEVVTGTLSGDLPGMAGHIPVPAFNPCAPSPNAPWDGRGMAELLNPRLCFTTGLSANYFPPATGTTSVAGCNSYNCVFLEAGGTSDITTHVVGGTVNWHADNGNYATWGTYGSSLSTNSIVNVADPALASLYQTMGYRDGLTYNFTLAAGQYNLRMGFVENYFKAKGQRVFSVQMNGNTILKDLDIFVLAGGENIAINISVPITVTANTPGQAGIVDYTVSLFFISSADAAQVSFIAITPPAVDAQIFGASTPYTPPRQNNDGSSSSSNAGPIAGGVVGGLVVLAIIVGVVVYLQRTKKNNVSTNNYLRDESRGSNSKNKKVSTISTVSNLQATV